MEQLSLITWNVNRRVQRLSEQMMALVSYTPDIIALQEVTATTQPLWRDQLQHAGYLYMVDNLKSTRLNTRNVLLIASRWPLTPLIDAGFPILTRPEAVLPVLIKTPTGMIHVYNIHIPTAANGIEVKNGLVDALYQWLVISPQSQLRIVCGDFNMPRHETLTGDLITFGQRLRKNGTWAVVDTLEDRIERQIMLGLAVFDLPDVFRTINGYTSQDVSWVACNRGRAFGFRLDHIFASRTLQPLECRYLHEVRETGLSDHSALMAIFR